MAADLPTYHVNHYVKKYMVRKAKKNEREVAHSGNKDFPELGNPRCLFKPFHIMMFSALQPRRVTVAIKTLEHRIRNLLTNQWSMKALTLITTTTRIFPRPVLLSHRNLCLATRPLFLRSHTSTHRSVPMDALVHTDSSTIKITSHNQYSSDVKISPQSVSPSPITQFEDWITAASAAGIKEPEAMTLSTCTLNGIPSSRIVLLKQVDSRGFVFFTNYTSRKSRELEENPHAALAFHWREISRQVRVVGTVEKVSREESEAYFRSRPLSSRVGAWASKQSSCVEENEVDMRVEKIRQKFGIKDDATGGEIPLPDFWGGWRVIPTEVEFWAGKPSRLHDRVQYLRVDTAETLEEPEWKIQRLALDHSARNKETVRPSINAVFLRRFRWRLGKKNTKTFFDGYPMS